MKTMTPNTYRARWMSGVLSFVLMAFVVSASWAQETEEPAAEPPAPPAEEQQAGPDLLSALESQGNYSSLVAALQETGLAEDLANAESFTIFAPTDDAFAAAGELSGEELASVLQYHVVPEAVTSEQLADMSEVSTLGGDMLPIGDGGSTVGGASIVGASIPAGNGVAIPIDQVLTPGGEQAQ